MKDSSDIKRDVNRGLAWIGLASSLVWTLDILSNVLILAFWVSPSEYGVAALALTLFPILDTATEMGLSAAIIQRDDHTDERICTVFWINLGMSLFLWAILAVGIGPLLSWIHDQPMVGLMLTAYGGKLVWNNVYLIPIAFMRRELRFKEISGVRTIANIMEFTGKVGSAAAGLGIWCFVIGPALRAIGYGLGAQYCHPWRPRLVFRFRDTLGWVTYGLKTSLSQILFHVQTNVDYQIVGYYFGATATGFYRLAYDIVLEPVRMISFVILQIAFPAYARLKNDRAQLIEQFVSFSRLNLVIMLLPIGLILVAAEDLLVSFWGARWEPAADAARVLCVVGAFRALAFVVPPLLDGMGRPGLNLAYMIATSIFMPVLFVLSAVFLGDRLDYLSVAWAWAIGFPICFAVLAYLALRLLDLSALAYLRRVMGVPLSAAAAAGLSAGATWLARSLPHSGRLAVAATTLLVAFGLLLAYTQGISPRSIRRALAGSPATPKE